MSLPGLDAATVNALYQQYLGRAPEAGVAEQWAAAGGAKASDLANALGTSQEFGMRAMADPTRTFAPNHGFAPDNATFSTVMPNGQLSLPNQPAMQPARPQMPGMGGGQPDWLGGILGQLFGADRMRGGMNMASWPAGGQPTAGGMGYSTMPAMKTGGNQFTDLFGASPGQFGSGATSGQQTSAMSNPLSASPFGRGFSTRQMGIPARNLM